MNFRQPAPQDFYINCLREAADHYNAVFYGRIESPISRESSKELASWLEQKASYETQKHYLGAWK